MDQSQQIHDLALELTSLIAEKPEIITEDFVAKFLDDYSKTAMLVESEVKKRAGEPQPGTATQSDYNW